jgi:predicted RNA-binding Zn ribbon-like protein
MSVEQLLAVANSYHEPEAHDEGSPEGPNWLPAHDHLDSAEAAVAFLARSGLTLTGAPQSSHLDALRKIRAAARRLVSDPAGYQRQTTRLLRDARFQLDGAGRLTPTGDGWDRHVDGLLTALVELREHADRLKVCQNDQCRWLFLDASKNRSRQWCLSATCGNRQRVRRFRQRAGAA